LGGKKEGTIGTVGEDWRKGYMTDRKKRARFLLRERSRPGNLKWTQGAERRGGGELGKSKEGGERKSP